MSRERGALPVKRGIGAGSVSGMGKIKIFTDTISRILYATDASAYRELPYGVCFPEGPDDIREIVKEASGRGLSVIPRCGGTSLAGQVVGSGIVADVSRYMNKVLEINSSERWVRVEPGVVLDELNRALERYGLFFAPETSTSNRCCIGGMVGNNSCGSHSLVYGSTRDHLLEAKVVLSDGSTAVFSKERAEAMLREAGKERERTETTLEERIYRYLYTLAADDALVERVNGEFPDKEVKRRNCGYALDLVLNDIRAWRRNETGAVVPNLCSVLAGSEGTLAFAYELKLNLVPLPPKEKLVLCAHCASLPDVFRANLVALEHGPVAVELMDKHVLELSKGNLSQQKNRFFVQGDPAAILIVELAKEGREELDAAAGELEAALLASGLVYSCSRVYGKDISRVWALRKAGLGLLSGMKGDSKPVSVIEDTAVAPARLPDYMSDFGHMLEELGLECVYHAHIGTGELHLRPVLNIKEAGGRRLFREVAVRTAALVKKHKGSLSGEHGDGRLRGEFIPLMYGDEIYGVMREMKRIWDPEGVFNPGKITDTPPMDSSLRYEVGQRYAAGDIDTYFDFSDVKGLFCAVEQCNGSGDCRKSVQFGGVMCPSFRVGGEERFSTRARANIIREMLTRSGGNPFLSSEAYEVLDSCISCKACKSECPSNVDMTRLKAEFLQQRFDARGRGWKRGEMFGRGGVPFRSFMVAHMAGIQRIGSAAPSVYNFFAGWKVSSGILKKVLAFSSERGIPALSRKTLRELAKRYTARMGRETGAAGQESRRRVYLFADEFTNYMEAGIGMKFVELLTALGYEVVIPEHVESGRAALSKGLLKVARRLAAKNVQALKDIIHEDTPLVGIEPSCILSFRDEYPALLGGSGKGWKGDSSLAAAAAVLGRNCLLYDEFIMREVKAGRITSGMFTASFARIWLHGHCHQKALAGIEASAEMLRLPVNYQVHVIPGGCCGMAGSYGYEKEHYATSMQMGEQVLFPAVRGMERERMEARRKGTDAGCEYIISAPGTSCRQQIWDGTGVKALHPVEVLWGALRKY